MNTFLKEKKKEVSLAISSSLNLKGKKPLKYQNRRNRPEMTRKSKTLFVIFLYHNAQPGQAFPLNSACVGQWTDSRAVRKVGAGRSATLWL